MHGFNFLASSNKSLTLDAPTPTNISTKSEPLIEKNGTFASPATAFASNVLPVPGPPTSNIPLGILAPISLNFLGSFKKSTISASSSFSSFNPATLSKVIFLGLFGLFSLALFFPKLNALLFPPPICCIRTNNIRSVITPSPIVGSQFNTTDHPDCSLTLSSNSPAFTFSSIESIKEVFEGKVTYLFTVSFLYTTSAEVLS